MKNTFKTIDYDVAMAKSRPKRKKPVRANLFWRTLIRVLTVFNLAGCGVTYTKERMELLGKDPEFNIRGDENTKIYARNDAHPSSYIDAGAKIVNAFVAEGSEIYGSVRHSVISVGCSIGEGAVVEDSVVMPGVVIESGAIVRHAILGENSKVCKNAVVGGAFAEGEKKQISVTSKGAVVETVLLPGDMV